MSAAGAEPVASRWVTRWVHLLAPGAAVLDVACGTGRHARFLARLGHPVTAVDRQPEALAALAAEPGVTTLQADLEGAPWPLAGLAFGAVVVTNYLHRPLWPHLLAALQPGGVLIYETFAAGNGSVGKPSNPAFLLRPGELLDAVRPALRVVAYQDVFVDDRAPAYVQRICAVAEVAREMSGNVAGNAAARDTPPPRYELLG